MASSTSPPIILQEANATLLALLSSARATAAPLVVPVACSLNNCNNQPRSSSFLKASLFDVLTRGERNDTPTTNDTLLVQQVSANIVDIVTKGDVQADRCVGALYGLAIGDSVGAPLEFVPADSSLPPYKLKLMQYDALGRDAFLSDDLDPTSGGLVYRGASNNFDLFPGQWTDDASMSFCLADSLLTTGKYHGGDCRTRYCHWWWLGLNNAFQFDRRAGQNSVGLGGNISKSLSEVVESSGGCGVEKVAAVFPAQGEDAGNGSIMRLAPIPILYHNSPREEMFAAAVQSSLATHPGNDAAACCTFVAYFVSDAINRPADDPRSIAKFLDDCISDFLAFADTQTSNSGLEKLKLVLTCAPPSVREAMWHWRQDRLQVEETLNARGGEYNGYPVDSAYLGSYCMDGLAMSLWSIFHATSFENCILRVVNLLGDADTTGAICGQMVGAFYGYRAQVNGSILSSRMVADVHMWDPYHEIELRALMLHRLAMGENL